MNFFERMQRATLDYSYEPVPQDKTIPSWRLFGVWFGVIVNLALMNFGITMSRSMPLKEALLAFIIGKVILATLFALSGIIGTRTRLPFGALIKVTLGRYGAVIVLLAIALTLMGWFAFQLELFANTLQNLIYGKSPSHMRTFFVLFGGLLMITTSAIGFRAVDWFAQFATPILLLILAWPVIGYYLTHRGFELLAIQIAEKDRLPFGSALSVVVSGSALGLLIISDVSRYGRSVKGTVLSTWTSFVFGGGLVFLISILLGRISPGPDLASIVPGLGVGVTVIGGPFLLLTTWSTNDPNVYVASVSVAGVIRSLRRWVLAVCLGIIGIGIAFIGIVKHFLAWLALIGMVFAPAGAVFMLDCFLHPSQYHGAHKKATPSIRLRPIVAWLGGTTVTYLTSKPSGLGLGLFVLTNVPALDGFLVAVILYLLLIELPSLIVVWADQPGENLQQPEE